MKHCDQSHFLLNQAWSSLFTGLQCNFHIQQKASLLEKIKKERLLYKTHIFFQTNFVYFQFLYHNSHDKFDNQITVLNQINQKES